MEIEQKIIGIGAEAVLYRLENADSDVVVKDRIKKKYRIPEIDDELRKLRTRREAKVLDKLTEVNFPAPKLIYTDRKSIIHMQLLDGLKLSRNLEACDYKDISKQIGKLVAQLHSLDIIHGDLTTSNILFDKGLQKIFFIDFGLSFFSIKVEDRAVDLHLIKQALESKHFTIYEDCFSILIKEYVKYMENGKEILKRLDVVESRGRNRTKNK